MTESLVGTDFALRRDRIHNQHSANQLISVIVVVVLDRIELFRRHHHAGGGEVDAKFRFGRKQRIFGGNPSEMGNFD